MATRILRYPNSLLPHGLAVAYALLGWLLALVLVSAEALALNLIGVLLLTHAMVIAAYLVHECAHNTIFTDTRHNAWLGEALNWLTGACYGRYEDIRHKHFRHHVDRGDVVAFDFRAELEHRPLLRRLVQAGEWLYIPAVDLVMHTLVLVLPFVRERRPGLRRRVLTVLAVRLCAFAALAAVSIKAVLLYCLSWLLFLHVMRFMDVHQHTYEVLPSLDGEPDPAAPTRDRDYEEQNTYSNLISERHPWLNLLTLNFSYHNAHHVRPALPWYQLPALHRELYGTQPTKRVLSFPQLLGAYHRYRVARVLNDDPPGMDVGDGRGFVGVVGVSFLTAH